MELTEIIVFRIREATFRRRIYDLGITGLMKYGFIESRINEDSLNLNAVFNESIRNLVFIFFQRLLILYRVIYLIEQ